MRKIKISIVIPFFNEEENVFLLCNRIDEVLRSLDLNYEILAVNDGSTDQTKQLIEKASKEFNVQLIQLSRNWGQSASIRAGLARASGDYIVVMDGDFQDNPNLIEEIVNLLLSGVDIVFINRIQRPVSLPYRILHRGFYRILRVVTRVKSKGELGNYSGFSKKVLFAINSFSEPNLTLPEILKWVGFQSVNIYYQVEERMGGRTKYSFKGRAKIGLSIILNAGMQRLLIFTFLLGFIMFGAALSILLLSVIRQIFGYGHLSGTGNLLVFSFGIISYLILMIGVLGIYTSRLFSEAKGRPVYFIDEESR